MTLSALYASFGGRILVYSSDSKDYADIRVGFERDGFNVVTLNNLDDLYKVDLRDFNLVLFELPEDPDRSLHAIQKVKESGNNYGIPLLVFCTSRSSESLVNALNAGADDYLVKPFSIRELTARVRAVLRTARRG